LGKSSFSALTTTNLILSFKLLGVFSIALAIAFLLMSSPVKELAFLANTKLSRPSPQPISKTFLSIVLTNYSNSFSSFLFGSIFILGFEKDYFNLTPKRELFFL